MTSLWNSVASAGLKGAFHARTASIAFSDLAKASCLEPGPEAFRGRSVLLVMREQLGTPLRSSSSTGWRGVLVLCTPDVSAQRRCAEVRPPSRPTRELADLDPARRAHPGHRAARGGRHRMDSADLRDHRNTQTGRA